MKMSTNWSVLFRMPLFHTNQRQFNVLTQHDFAHPLAYKGPATGLHLIPETTARPSLEGHHAQYTPFAPPDLYSPDHSPGILPDHFAGNRRKLARA
ncbi:hypothetical protein [Stenotrophomonas pavanii]|uniref:hypothetical protein n=1 Tax=Stenotrophomonas pavanii TaxID=487698 RepID=UPI0039C5FFFA